MSKLLPFALIHLLLTLVIMCTLTFGITIISVITARGYVQVIADMFIAYASIYITSKLINLFYKWLKKHEETKS